MIVRGEWYIPIRDITEKGLTSPHFWKRDAFIELYENNKEINTIFLLKMLHYKTIKYDFHLIHSDDIKNDRDIIAEKYPEYLSEYSKIKTLNDLELVLFTVEHILS